MSTKNKFFKNRIGEILESNNYGKFEIVEFIDKNNIIVRFVDTGTMIRTRTANILVRSIKDPSIKGLVFGFGINDVDYKITKYSTINGVKHLIWQCPYYQKWRSILQRCFDMKFQEKNPTYVGATIDPEWKYLSKFIKWVDSQPNKDWVNCEPDKDFLIEGNKHYSPETVVFITRKTNSFILSNKAQRGTCMIGVCYHPEGNNKNPFVASCCDPFLSGQQQLGYFRTELEAHKTWQAKKHEHALRLADEQDDPRVAKVLRERYAPDKDWSTR